MSFTVNDNSVWQVTMNGRFNSNQDILNTFQMRLVSGGPLTPSAFADEIETYLRQIYNVVKVICSGLQVWESFSYAGLLGVNVFGPRDLVPTITGDGVTDSVPPGVAALISWPTGIKRVVMRKYFGVLDEEFVGGAGALTTPAIAQMDVVADLLTNPYVNGGVEIQNGYFSPKTNNFEVPIEGRSNRAAAYQRRRKPNVGS